MSRDEFQVLSAANEVAGMAAQILRNIEYCAQHGDTIGKDISDMYVNMLHTQIEGTVEYLRAMNRDIMKRKEAGHD